MKENEAPERLYLSNNIYSTYLYQVPDPDDDTAVEYTRTDAFIKKTEEYLYKQLNEGNMECGDIETFIEDFRNYIEGE